MCVCVHVHACVRACVCVLQHQDVLLHAEDESSVGSQFEILILHHIIHLHQLTNVLCVHVWGCASGSVCMCVGGRVCGIWGGTAIAIPILCLIVYRIPALDSQNVWRYEIIKPS